MAPLRIATRGSAQATTQARGVAHALGAAGYTAELVLIETFGDRTQAADVPLHSIGGQGVFVKEVQRAVLDGRADIAVHSAKDLPTSETDGLTLAAFAERRSAVDVLIGSTLDSLPIGAPVATGSVRRRAQLQAVRPDLVFRELRGNILTRLERVPDGGAIVMALAALEVLGLTDRVAQVLDPTQFVPAVGQGCVAAECRTADAATAEALATIDHPATRRDVMIERAFLAELGAGCSLPVGAHVIGTTLHVYLCNPDDGTTARTTVALTGELDADLSLAAGAADDARRAVSGQ